MLPRPSLGLMYSTPGLEKTRFLANSGQKAFEEDAPQESGLPLVETPQEPGLERSRFWSVESGINRILEQKKSLFMCTRTRETKKSEQELESAQKKKKKSMMH